MENRNLNLDDYIAIAKRRGVLGGLVLFAIFLMSLLVINALPPIYRSTGKIAVESQQIPEGFVQSTISGFADERIGFINQRIMTTSRLQEIINKFQLFPEERGEEPESVLVGKLRERIFLETIRDPVVARGGIVAFTIGYEDRNPQIAAAVASELVTAFLDENVRTRNARASETTDFLKREAARLGQQVNVLEARVASYKQEHSDALPEHLDLHLSMLQRSEASLKDVDREIVSLEEERRFLSTQRVSLSTNLSAGATPDRLAISPAQQLAALRIELVEKTAIYSAAHPDLAWLRRRIDALEREVRMRPADNERDSASRVYDPAIAQIDSQIVTVNTRLTSLRDQKTELEKKIESLQEIVLKTPQVERELKGLNRDYESAISEYKDISSKQREAELAENLEAEQKAERFVLLEAPQIPSVPEWPNKPKAYALAFALSVGTGAAAAWIAEFLDNTIRGPTMLTAILQRHPIAVIPIIENSRDRRRVAKKGVWLFIAILLLLTAALATVHFFFEPLDDAVHYFLQLAARI